MRRTSQGLEGAGFAMKMALARVMGLMIYMAAVSHRLISRSRVSPHTFSVGCSRARLGTRTSALGPIWKELIRLWSRQWYKR